MWHARKNNTLKTLEFVNIGGLPRQSICAACKEKWVASLACGARHNVHTWVSISYIQVIYKLHPNYNKLYYNYINYNITTFYEDELLVFIIYSTWFYFILFFLNQSRHAVLYICRKVDLARRPGNQFDCRVKLAHVLNNIIIHSTDRQGYAYVTAVFSTLFPTISSFSVHTLF